MNGHWHSFTLFSMIKIQSCEWKTLQVKGWTSIQKCSLICNKVWPFTAQHANCSKNNMVSQKAHHISFSYSVAGDYGSIALSNKL